LDFDREPLIELPSCGALEVLVAGDMGGAGDRDQRGRALVELLIIFRVCHIFILYKAARPTGRHNRARDRARKKSGDSRRKSPLI
jgi:hypothetical protein